MKYALLFTSEADVYATATESAICNDFDCVNPFKISSTPSIDLSTSRIEENDFETQDDVYHALLDAYEHGGIFEEHILTALHQMTTITKR